MRNVATLTLNPALDLSTSTERVFPTEKLRCGPPRYDPGGGGINVARVVQRLGGQVTAVYTAGGLVGQMLRNNLDAIGLDQRVVAIAGLTRESFTVDETSTGKQYRFVLPGPELLPSEVSHCLTSLGEIHPTPEYVVASGSFPPNVDARSTGAAVAAVAERIGARLILDTSQAMRHAPRHGVFLMKPNAEELGAMVGHPCETRDQQIAAARVAVRECRAAVLVVSLGAEGALLVTEEMVEHFPAPKVEVHSAVGAGDSMIGGIVFALASGRSLSDAVRYGIAAGSATLMTPGTELCHRTDVERLFEGMARAPSAAPA
jgi:6-phosphofructokinase 2